MRSVAGPHLAHRDRPEDWTLRCRSINPKHQKVIDAVARKGLSLEGSQSECVDQLIATSKLEAKKAPTMEKDRRTL